MASKSYWSYGKVNHKDGALIPEGRVLIDTAKSFVYTEDGLKGVLEMTSVHSLRAIVFLDIGQQWRQDGFIVNFLYCYSHFKPDPHNLLHLFGKETKIIACFRYRRVIGLHNRICY